MQTRISAAVLIALAAAGCGHRAKDMGARSDSTALHNDTSAMTAPAVVTPTDTAADTTMQPVAKVKAAVRGGQTQSGVTDKTGRSTLGPGIKKARPDQNQPVTAKGDTLSTSPLPQATDSVNQRMTPSSMPLRTDTLPPPLDTRRDTTVTDSLKPVVDSLRPMTDSIRPTPLMPADSTHPDTTKP